jgi:hypothetical protein
MYYQLSLKIHKHLMTLHSLGRPQRLPKEVGSLKTTSNVPNYLLAEALEICLKPGGLDFRYVLRL